MRALAGLQAPQHVARVLTAGTLPSAGAADLETALLKERARCAEMEMSARALAGELLRAQHASLAIGRAVLPALSGIEHRLKQQTQQLVAAQPP